MLKTKDTNPMHFFESPDHYFKIKRKKGVKEYGQWMFNNGYNTALVECRLKVRELEAKIQKLEKVRFTVIDKQTGKYPNLQEIALKEDWANNLISFDMSGFLIDEDGWLYLADDCGNIACCPQDRFKVIYQDDFETS